MLPSCDTQYAPNLILQHGYAYDYDFNGNRVIANGSNYTTSTNNELTSDGVWSYTYDDEGNRISKQNSTHRELYTWDYRNRLTSVTKQTYNAETGTWENVQIVEYAYDYNNVWIRKVLDSNGDGTADSKSIFIPENYQTVAQIDNGAVSHHYLWTPNQQDKLLADVTTEDILWALTDHLGSIRDVVGTTTNTHIIYDAYGNIISCKNSEGETISNPILFGYTGKPFDTDTQLQNNINRWYDASIGRWLSQDPIGFEGNDTNLYRYCSNKSIIICDNFGLDTFRSANGKWVISVKMKDSESHYQSGALPEGHGHFRGNTDYAEKELKIGTKTGDVYNKHNKKIEMNIKKKMGKSWDEFQDWLKKKGLKIGCSVTISVFLVESVVASESISEAGNSLLQNSKETAKEIALEGIVGVGTVAAVTASGMKLTANGMIIAGSGASVGIGTTVAVGGAVVAAGTGGFMIGNAISQTTIGQKTTKAIGEGLASICPWCFLW